MKSLKIIIVIFSTLLLPQHNHSHNDNHNHSNIPKTASLSGTIIDQITDKPVPYATITLFSIVGCLFKLGLAIEFFGLSAPKVTP